MRIALFAIALAYSSISFAAPGLPEKKDPAPKKGAVEDQPFVTTAWSKDGAILINRQTTQFVNEVRTMQVVVDGKVMNVNVTVTVPVTVVTTIKLDPKTLEVKSPDGKLVDPADVPKLLKEKTKVIVSPNGKPVSDAMRKEHADAVTIVVKPAK